MDLQLFGVSTHNLKRVDITIPKGKFVVFTGVSGSGKSSLLFDTIHMEGRFRYLDTLSEEVGFFTHKGRRPTLIGASGLSPTLVLEQKRGRHAHRSHVVDVAALTDTLKLLYTHLGVPTCPRGHGQVRAHSIEEVVVRLVAFPPRTKMTLLAPMSGPLTPEFRVLLLKQGFTRVLLPEYGRFDLDSDSLLPEHDRYYVVVDRILLKENSAPRLAGSVELAYTISGGRCAVQIPGEADLEFYHDLRCPKCGFVFLSPWPGLFSRFSRKGRCEVCHGDPAARTTCPSCGGSGYAEAARSYTISGRTVDAITSLTIDLLADLVRGLKPREEAVWRAVCLPLKEKLSWLQEFGLGRLPLNTPLKDLSKGEAQLLRLASLESRGLTSVIVILDEPTQGLTSAERPLVLKLIQDLVARGDTVLVSEHDPSFLALADHIVELGPGAGVQGGKILFSGTYEELLLCEASPTAAFLRGEVALTRPQPRPEHQLSFGLREVDHRYFRGLSLELPYNRWTVIDGPMGVGKSTLLHEILAVGMASRVPPELSYGERWGEELFVGGVVSVDFDALPTSPYSHIASYLGIFSPIRGLLAQTTLAKVRGFKGGTFSLKTKGGRCALCSGLGSISLDLGPLTQVEVPCSRCGGKRFRTEVLEVHYRGKSIHQLLEMSVDQGAAFFVNHPPIAQKLALLQQIGLGYLKLGQPVRTLSGGESQRLKLGRDLTRRNKKSTLYLLDEPATGLHLKDIRLLAELFQRLVDEGHTVVTTDHSGLLSPLADGVVHLGDGAGALGGRVRAVSFGQEHAAKELSKERP